MKLTRRDFTAGLAAGITAPYVVGSARAQAATIKIGMCVPVTGPAAEQGLWAQNGAKLALAAVNKAGGVLGKQVELVIEDDQTTNPGIVLAFAAGIPWLLLHLLAKSPLAGTLVSYYAFPFLIAPCRTFLEGAAAGASISPLSASFTAAFSVP